MLFPTGKRPAIESVREAVAAIDGVTISHDPEAASPANVDGRHWLEVVIDGLTFDITGLAPGSSAPLASFVQSTHAGSSGAAEAVAIVPGPHLAGGTYILPVLRGLLSLGAHLGTELHHALAVGWPPSLNTASTAQLGKAAESWANGGAFPSEFLIRFERSPGGAFQSHGLSVFTGQELSLTSDIVESDDLAMRLGWRLANQLVLLGRIEVLEEITGPDGSMLRLAPSYDGDIVEVSRC
ncbi:hypothetical protein [Pontixanthobacter sp. CEM42]|uniref:hypothetical protein n=1 Tax=Pontixanthobacter sp. CEM42 TaxID=2792077 RepID=UPI001ADF0D56|nr:hypothetical protein [Pontixanthobacter sp. CEM42]